MLKKLSEVVDLPDTKVFAACVDAVTAGATLGEITRALRINDKPGIADHPRLHHPRRRAARSVCGPR